jgi:hypothetical protein
MIDIIYKEENYQKSSTLPLDSVFSLKMKIYSPAMMGNILNRS